jgi:protein-L-isoaspartate(D-aspartate) O-methyltransferase
MPSFLRSKSEPGAKVGQDGFVSAENRRIYVRELAAHGGLRSEALLRAFGAVPREKFLPPGPWIVEASDGSYYATETADVANVLHAVGIVLDPARDLINANPAKVGRMLEAAAIMPGETVLHVGAGLGFFSAIMAELVGPKGRVIAAEIDDRLASGARRNLAPWTNVEVVGDGLCHPAAAADVIFASAGVAALPLSWVRALRPGGRMIVPMIGSLHGGFLFRFEKHQAGHWLSAQARSFVRFFPCAGTRTREAIAAMDAAIADPRAPSVRHLRLDPHHRTSECWLHADGWCLTTAAVPVAGPRVAADVFVTPYHNLEKEAS